jgi:hypothetical protein
MASHTSRTYGGQMMRLYRECGSPICSGVIGQPHSGLILLWLFPWVGSQRLAAPTAIHGEPFGFSGPLTT